MRDVGEELLRPAVELAFLVAALGARRKPPLSVPAAVRPFLRFQKLPANAFDAVRDAVEANDEFRERVATAADEPTVGAAGMFWLQRPQGWAQNLRTMVADADADVANIGSPPMSRGREHRDVALERSLRDARAALAVTTAEMASAVRRLSDSEAALARFERTRAGMEQEIAGLQRKLARAASERDELTRLLAQREASPANTAVLAAKTREGVAKSEVVDSKTAASAATVATTAPSDVAMPDVQPFALDLVKFRAFVATAEAARADLDRALSAARQITSSSPRQAEARVVQVPATVGEKPERSHRTKRHRIRLPGGTLTDSVEAAMFLLARPDVVHVVDGYNVAKMAFPSAVLREQREQLLDLTDEIHARYRTEILVMFDGAEVGPVHALRRWASVQFSPPGVTADDLIVSWLTAAPLDQAVTVVTSDRAVRDAAEMLGAQLMHSASFLSASGRRIL